MSAASIVSAGIPVALHWSIDARTRSCASANWAGRSTPDASPTGFSKLLSGFRSGTFHRIQSAAHRRLHAEVINRVEAAVSFRKPVGRTLGTFTSIPFPSFETGPIATSFFACCLSKNKCYNITF